MYTHADGRREVVEVVAKYAEDSAGGGGYAIYIPSLARERGAMPRRLDRSQEHSFNDLGTFLDEEGGSAGDDGCDQEGQVHRCKRLESPPRFSYLKQARNTLGEGWDTPADSAGGEDAPPAWQPPRDERPTSDEGQRTQQLSSWTAGSWVVPFDRSYHEAPGMGLRHARSGMGGTARNPALFGSSTAGSPTLLGNSARPPDNVGSGRVHGGG